MPQVAHYLMSIETLFASAFTCPGRGSGKQRSGWTRPSSPGPTSGFTTLRIGSEPTTGKVVGCIQERDLKHRRIERCDGQWPEGACDWMRHFKTWGRPERELRPHRRVYTGLKFLHAPSSDCFWVCRWTATARHDRRQWAGCHHRQGFAAAILRPFGKAIVCLAVCALQRRSAVATDRAPGSPRTPHHTDFYILLQHDGFSTSVIDFLPDVRITIFDADT